MYFGYIKRKEYLNNTVKYYPFSPLAVLQDDQDIILSNGDEVNILSYKE